MSDEYGDLTKAEFEFQEFFHARAGDAYWTEFWDHIRAIQEEAVHKAWARVDDECSGKIGVGFREVKALIHGPYKPEVENRVQPLSISNSGKLPWD